MEYTLETCSTYKCRTICSKTIYIFDSHNMALPIWGTYSSRLSESLNLVTFDTHTDTRNPFARFLSRNGSEISRRYMQDSNVQRCLNNAHYRRVDFCFEDVWSIATAEIAHDEHIKTAYDWGYLASYTIVCNQSNETVLSYQEDDVADGLPAYYISGDTWLDKCNSVIDRLNGKLLALDFDLDFFRSPNDADERFWNSIAPLIMQSSIITIAREEECFNKEKLDPCFTNQMALDILIEKIQQLIFHS